MRNKFFIGFVVMLCFVGLVAMAAPARAQTTLSMAAMGATSDTYMVAVGWSNVLKRINSDIAITPLEGGGVVMLARGMAQGKWDISFISTPHYLDAMQGKGQFEKDPAELHGKYKTFRSLFGVTSGLGMYVVRADSNIKDYIDLKGKKIAIGRPGGGGAKIGPVILKAHGLEAGDYKAEFLDPGPALDEMRNNRLDCAAVWGGIPQSSIYEFSRQIPVHFPSFTKEAFEKFKKMMPNGDQFILRSYSAEDLKKAYGSGIVQEGQVNFWTFQMQVVVREDMPEETAYKIVKAFWENLNDIKATGAALANMNKDDSLESLSATLHPGALKYYKEKGWIK
ncbi:MAG: TAXI family TRAP transporter solute-binding subunit [Thermodesulfobacteriota bacterium]